MAARTPEQIIGKDRVLQLIFEGYEVVPVKEKEDLSKLSNEELFRRAYPNGIGDVNSGNR